MLKFEFSIQTRSGQKLDGIVIMTHDREEAERRLRQMYRYCSILDCKVKYRAPGEKHWQLAPAEELGEPKPA